MKALKKYRFGFDIWALLLFIIIMVPNIIWVAVPAENDVLRSDSITPSIDIVASIAQILMIIALCVTMRKDSNETSRKKQIIIVIFLVVLYDLGWIAYYLGQTGTMTILDLCISPSLAFVVFSIYRRNYIALIPAMIFTSCHIVFGVVNFII